MWIQPNVNPALYNLPSAQDPRVRSRPYIKEDENSILASVAMLTGLGGVAAAGTLMSMANLQGRSGTVYNVYDLISKSFKAVEEASPGRILRTLHLSEITSLAGKAPNVFHWAPDTLKKSAVRDYIRGIIGHGAGSSRTFNAAINEGLIFHRTGGVFGRIVTAKTGQVIAEQALVSTYGSHTTLSLGNWFAGLQSGRDQVLKGLFHRDANVTHAFYALRKDDPWVKGIASFFRLPQETATKITIAGRAARAAASQLLGRFYTSTLGTAETVGQIPLIGQPLERLIYSVTSGAAGSPLAMMGRLTMVGLKAKLAVDIASGVGTLKRADSDTAAALLAGGLGALIGKAVRPHGLMSRAKWTLGKRMGLGALIGAASTLVPAFQQGYGIGLLESSSRLHMAYAKMSDFLGFTGAAKKLEEEYPGASSPMQMLGFALSGGLAMKLGQWGHRLLQTKKLAATMGWDKAHTTVEAMDRTIIQGLNARQKIIRGSGRFAALREYFSLKGLSTRADKFRYKGGRWGFLAGAALGLGLAIASSIAATANPLAFLGSTKSQEELEGIYQGYEDVPIRKGRYWEAGSSPYSGEQIMYWRKHLLPLMKSGAEEVAVWGGPGQRAEYDPTIPFNWPKALFSDDFKYFLERKHYYDRPALQTGTYGEETPFIGPLVAATLGRAIKPPRPMHSEYWGSEDGSGGLGGPYSVLGGPKLGFNMEPFGGVGEGELYGMRLNTPGAPTYEAGRQFYNMTEMVGLPGYLFESAKYAATGERYFGLEGMTLSSADKIDSFQRKYWDLQLGGMFGMNEIWRRIVPPERGETEWLNPIPNQMPQWMPERHWMEFNRGDAYSKLQMGEARLPGIGYNLLNGLPHHLEPENYPDLHKLKILSDVAPWSTEFHKVKKTVENQLKKKQLQEADKEFYDKIIEQRRQRIDNSGEFDEYKTGLPRVYQAFTHMFSTNPIEKLSPFRPGAKFISKWTAIEHYEDRELYGSRSANWAELWDDFVRPFALTTLNKLGVYSDVPNDVQERRQIDEYFDKLKFIKGLILEHEAKQTGNNLALLEAKRIKEKSILGLNIYTTDEGKIMRALPHYEQRYFRAFMNTQDPIERNRILEMIPPNLRELYKAQFEVYAEKKRLLEDGKTEEEIQKILGPVFGDRKGRKITTDLLREQKKVGLKNVSPEDYSRLQEAAEFFSKSKYKFPGARWIAFNPVVDLDDVKLKYVENTGADFHDHYLWEDRRKSLGFKPYIEEAVNEITTNQGNFTHAHGMTTEAFRHLFNSSRVSANIKKGVTRETEINMNILDKRKKAFHMYFNDPEGPWIDYGNL